VFGTITETNKYIYITEQQIKYTILSNQNKVYLIENNVERILTLTPGVYDEANLATELQIHLGAAFTVSSTTGQLYVSSAENWKIYSRLEMQTKNNFAGVQIVPYALQDINDLFDTISSVYVSAQGLSGDIQLGFSKIYRRVELTTGQYSFTELATVLQNSLNNESSLLSYVVTPDPTKGKLTITNPSTLLFEIYSEEYLTTNKYAFIGYSNPFFGSDHTTGFSGRNILQGNTITGEQHVNIMRHHTIFINSDLGTHNDSIGPLSQTTIARKIVVDQPYGSMINDYHSLAFDYIASEKQSLAAMRFRLTDWMGQSIEMTAGWSLSIVLVPEEEF
jgi:hypothetical protein